MTVKALTVVFCLTKTTSCASGFDSILKVYLYLFLDQNSVFFRRIGFITILNLYMLVITEYSCRNIEIIVIVSRSDIDLVSSHNTVERLLKNAKDPDSLQNRR